MAKRSRNSSSSEVLCDNANSCMSTQPPMPTMDVIAQPLVLLCPGHDRQSAYDVLATEDLHRSVNLDERELIVGLRERLVLLVVEDNHIA